MPGAAAGSPTPQASATDDHRIGHFVPTRSIIRPALTDRNIGSTE